MNIGIKYKVAKLRNGKSISFEKPILASRPKPYILPYKGHINLGKRLLNHRGLDHLNEMLKAVSGSRRITIIGGSFKSIEFADNLVKTRRKVVIILYSPHMLVFSSNDEFCELDAIVAIEGLDLNRRC